MELIETNKPGHFYYVDAQNYIYIKDAVGKPTKDPHNFKLYFRCLQTECKGRAIWRRADVDNEIVEFSVEHSHEPNLRKKLELFYRARMRKRVSTELSTSLRQIFLEEKEYAMKNGLDLGNYKSWFGMLKRARKLGESGPSFIAPVAQVPQADINLKSANLPQYSVDHSYTTYTCPDEEIKRESVITNEEVILKDESDNENDMEVMIESRERSCHSPLVEMTLPALVAPVFTPLNSDNTINYNMIDTYADFLKDNGISGVLVNGEIGEGFSASVVQRKNLAEAWIQAKKINPELQVLIHVGGAPFNDILELTKHANQIKADAIVCLPDIYMKPKNCQDLRRYLQFIAHTAPEIPFLYDHNPSISDVNLSVVTLMEEAVESIPNFAGIKFSSGNLDEGIEAVNCNDGKFFVFWGSDQLIASALMGGFQCISCPSLNVFPNICTKIMESFMESDLSESRQQQDFLNKICSTIKRNGDFMPGMKAMMNIYTTVQVGKVREPLNNFKNKHLQEFTEEMKAIIPTT